MILCRYSKAFDSILLIIIDDFLGFFLITEIKLIKNNMLLLLISLNYSIKLTISTRKRYASISYLQENINIFAVLLNISKSLPHMPRKPIYCISYLCDWFHFFFLKYFKSVFKYLYKHQNFINLYWSFTIISLW